MIAQLVKSESQRQQFTTTWVDEVSGAFMTETANFNPVDRSVSCAIELSAFRTSRQGYPHVHGRLENSKLLIPEVRSQNREAANYLSGLKKENGLDRVWYVSRFDSDGEKPALAIRFVTLIDQVIARYGGGMRVVFDNSTVWRHVGNTKGFTTKVMNRRITRGDLVDRQIDFFPAEGKKGRNCWVYPIASL